MAILKFDSVSKNVQRNFHRALVWEPESNAAGLML